jgi:hypothetical protein
MIYVDPLIILLFEDDLRIYRNIIRVNDRRRLQHDNGSVQKLCLNKRMKLHISKTTVNHLIVKLTVARPPRAEDL